MSRDNIPPIAPLPTDYTQPFVTVWCDVNTYRSVVVVRRGTIEVIAPGFDKETFRPARPGENPVYLAQEAAHLLGLPCAVRQLKQLTLFDDETVFPEDHQ